MGSNQVAQYFRKCSLDNELLPCVSWEGLRCFCWGEDEGHLNYKHHTWIVFLRDKLTRLNTKGLMVHSIIFEMCLMANMAKWESFRVFYFKKDLQWHKLELIFKVIKSHLQSLVSLQWVQNFSMVLWSRSQACRKQKKSQFYQIQTSKLSGRAYESQLECPVVNILPWKQNHEQQDTTGFHGDWYLYTLKNDCCFLYGEFTREWIVEVTLAICVKINRQTKIPFN